MHPYLTFRLHVCEKGPSKHGSCGATLTILSLYFLGPVWLHATVSGCAGKHGMRLG